MSAPPPTTFVLVHGAWHGGWCWRFVADQFKAGGGRVFAPTLTGLGERAHLLDKTVNLSIHIEDICRLIRRTRTGLQQGLCSRREMALPRFRWVPQGVAGGQGLENGYLDCGHEAMVDAPELVADV